jgi:tyrosyl-tRNA synthetase
MVVAALWLLDYLDYVLPTRHFRRLTVRCKWSRDNIDELTKRLKVRGLRIEHFNYQRLQGGDVAELDVTVSFLSVPRFRAVEAELHDDPAYMLMSSARI